VDQPHFPRPQPVLNRFLSLNCQSDVVVVLAVNEHLESVSLCKTFYEAHAVFERAAGQITGDAGAENAVAPIGHEIEPAASHSSIQEDVDGRDKPGHDEYERPEKAPQGNRNLDVTFYLTLVSDTVTAYSSLIEGHGAEAHRVMGARAVPAGGFAACSRAAWVSCLPALRPGWEVHPWTGIGEGG
jgi:hypothetical protein